jgi:hypothetical protein
MITTLHRFIDPANYHTEAVTDAGKSDVATLASGLLIVRLAIALHGADAADAQAAIALLEKGNRQGYELCQLMTAKLIIALWSEDYGVISFALEAWLDARRPAPGNWLNEVLNAPELTTYVAEIEPAKLALPPPKRPTVTKAVRALVKDLDCARVQAVTENLTWLRELGLKGPVKAIAKSYKIAFANHHLREVTLTSKNENWPDLIVALDEHGGVLGSFIAH